MSRKVYDDLVIAGFEVEPLECAIEVVDPAGEVAIHKN